MNDYEIAKDILEVKESLKRIEATINSGKPQRFQENSENKGDRTYLVLANHTKRDIHIQVLGAVKDGNWGPSQVNHNEEPEVKSKKINFGNKATYLIKVWANKNGKPGLFIGEFEHGVRYNLAGNRDHLEFVIADIEGETHLKVISVREVGEVALMLWLGI